MAKQLQKLELTWIGKGDEQKVKEQRIIKELEKKLADKRYNQYQNEDEIENRKDNLLDDVEKRLKQQTTDNILFTIKWKLI